MRLGEQLQLDGAVTAAQIDAALAHQRVTGMRLGSALMALGYLHEADLARALGRQHAVPSICLGDRALDSAALHLLPGDMAWRYLAVPVIRTAQALTVAMIDPADVPATDAIAALTGLPIEPVVACEASLRAALVRHYPGGAAGRSEAPSDPLARALADLGLLADTHPDDAGERAAPDRLSEDSPQYDAPVTRLVNALLLSAVSRGASDIHLEPYERDLRVRFRIDGVLHVVPAPPWRYRESLVSRIKILAQLDIAERRLPQDGRFKVHLSEPGASRELDVRVSSLPTLFGEKLVLRLLDHDRVRLDLVDLGFTPEALSLFEAAIRRPWGLVLVTGPTGSGKTNTLYSAISQLNQPGVNIVTAEDPVEVHLPGITQVAVRDQIGLTFATTLRAFLRQDPNIILVGEIRDNETAAMAVKAALTGHLVLSTLHTGDAPAAISRLVHMGVEPVLLAGAVSLVCAQRLVRRVCEGCRVPAVIDEAVWRDAGGLEALRPGDSPVRGVGCARCGQAGYRGRIGLFEVMPIDDRIRAAMLEGADTGTLRRLAVRDGMVSLRQQGLRAVRSGITTLDEVLRETVAAC